LALKDAYAVFAVTNFFESFSKEREIQQGKNVADVAKVCDGSSSLCTLSLTPPGTQCAAFNLEHLAQCHKKYFLLIPQTIEIPKT